jgi:integrase
MPQTAKPTRLWLNRAQGLWYILGFENGKRRQIATGCRADDRRGAEEALAAHIAAKPSRDSGRDPTSIPIAEILSLYATDRGQRIARPDELKRRLSTLLDFFGDKTVAAINRSLCRQYVAVRREQAARRELEDLRAALGHAFDEEILANDVRKRIELPPKAPRREQWLTRVEAARLIRAAWRFKQRERDGVPGRHTRQHVARFILVALYTGTRSAAVCGAAMTIGGRGGYVDLEQGVLYRREPGSVETNKRQPPVRLPSRLLAHIRRWKRRGISTKAVVEWNGEPVLSVYGAFKHCVADAGLNSKVSPHTLRHTAISWALQNGRSTWEVSGFFGVSQQVIEATYGHHCPQQHQAVAEAITRRR